MQNQDNCIFTLSEEETHIFTPIQITVLYQRITGKAYKEIKQNNPSIKTPKVLKNLLKWILCGRKINIGDTFGRPSLIGDVQMLIFKK